MRVPDIGFIPSIWDYLTEKWAKNDIKSISQKPNVFPLNILTILLIKVFVVLIYVDFARLIPKTFLSHFIILFLKQRGSA